MSTTFTPATSTAAGQSPASVETADVNGDGRLDLVVADLGGGVDVLLGNGAGGFSAATSYAAGHAPESATTADVNQDGKLDLVVVNDGGVDVLLGNGAGGFSAATAYAAGSNSYSVTTADVNRDGKPDLVVGNLGGGVDVLLGNGAGGFSAAISYAAGDGPFSVTSADVNRDGKPDLVTVDVGGVVDVLLGNGAGGFSAATSYEAGDNPNSVTTADVNRDGKLDLVVADERGSVDVLLGDGAGGFSAATSYAAGSTPYSVTTADVNGDGKPDLVVADFEGGVDVLLGDGSGGFSAATSYAAGTLPVSVTTADVNRDGVLDLVVAARDGSVHVLLGENAVTVTSITATSPGGADIGAGETVTFTVATSQPVTVSDPADTDLVLDATGTGGVTQTASYVGGSGTASLTFSYTVQAGDTAADLEVLGLTLNGGNLAVPGTLSFSAATSYAAGTNPNLVTTADVNGDGKPDLVVADANGGVDVLLGNGSGGFSAATSYAAGSSPFSVTTADVNGDGKLDLVVADYFGGVDVLLGNGSGGFSAATSYAAGTNPNFVATADVNRDGKLDLVVADGEGGVDVLLGNGSGGFSAAATYAAGSSPRSVTSADVNGDGELDLVVADYFGGVDVLLGNGSGGFSAATSYAAGLLPRSVTSADVNGDGKPDLVVADVGGGVDVLLGDGAGGFSAATSYAASANPYSVTTADVNVDGKPDLVVAENGGGVDVLLGNGSGGFSAAATYAAGPYPRSVATADVNGDGRPDLVVADNGGGVDVLLNSSTAPGTFVPASAATAPGGNTGIIVDTTAPAAPSTPANASVMNGTVNAASDTSGQTITGTAEASSTVKVYDGATLVDTTAANGSGSWSYQVGVLADGTSHSYTATATDAAGNTGPASGALAFTVDTVAPTAPSTPADASVMNGFVDAANDTAAQTITGTAEASSTVRVYDGATLVDTTAANGSGSWSYQVGTLADGTSHSYTATATDAAGNTGPASGALAFTVDTVAPTAPSTPADASVMNGFVDAANDTAAQTITGTAEASSTVRVYDGATLVDTTAANGSGSWSYQVGTLADGTSHSYTATATDAAGNTGPASGALAFTVDTVAPTAPSTPADASVMNGFVDAANDTAAQTITGTAEASSTVRVYDGATLVDTTAANGSGSWSYQVGTLADGTSHSYTATATDAAGNTGPASGALAFTVDTVAPTAPSTPADASAMNGFVDAANDTAAQTITGTAEASSTVRVYDGATLVDTTAANGSGSWSYQVGTLADGTSHSYTATATDAAGNTGPASGALAFTVDTVAPTAPSTPADASVMNGFVDAANDTAAQTITGTAEASSTVRVYDGATLVDTTAANGSGSWSYQVGTLADGTSHSYTATATDAAGNTGPASGALAFTVDTVAPTAPSTPADASVMNGFVDAANDTAAQTITGTAEASSTVRVYDGATLVDTTAANGSGSWSYQVGTLADGTSHSYTATATDAAGNTGPASGALAFTVDTVAPTAPSTPADASVMNGFVDAANDTAAQTITGTAEASSTVRVYDGATLVDTTAANGSGSWSYQVGTLADGTSHSYTATATDAAGNTGPASGALAFTVDTVAPTAPSTPADASAMNGFVDAANDTAAQTITGTAEASSTVRVYDGATLVDTTAANGSGSWSYQVGTLADGTSHSYTATATDAAGNTGPASGALAFTVDTVAPTAPSTPADASVMNGFVDAANDTAAQTITGTAEASSTVRVYDGATLVDTTAANGSGSWSYQVGTLADGTSHSYTATATDAAGNTGPASGALAFTVDTTAPADAVSFDPNAAFAKHEAFVLTGTTSSPAGVASVEISAEVDGAVTDLGAATLNPDGTFTFTDHVGPHVQDFITATETDTAGGTASAGASYSLEAGIAGGPTVAREDEHAADGSALTDSTLYRRNGSSTTIADAPGQTLSSHAFDIFDNHHEADTTFVFDPGFGIDVIDGFRLGGPGHDVLDLPASDFTSIADVLRTTGDIQGSAFITDPKTGDAIRIAGVTTAELKAHPRDITFHV